MDTIASLANFQYCRFSDFCGSGGGDSFAEIKPVTGGLLGADYEVANNRYRFKKIYGGLNWNPLLRSPLTEPGVNAKAGEYLIAIDGRAILPPANLYSFFENTAGKSIELTLGSRADGTGARTVLVVPVATEDALRNRDWVEGNIRKVDAATNGRVAYVYVPNTAGLKGATAAANPSAPSNPYIELGNTSAEVDAYSHVGSLLGILKSTARQSLTVRQATNGAPRVH